MTRTFDIRFAQSSGLAALLEAPTNSFRWKGAGLLRIDADGVHLAARHGFLSLFSARGEKHFGAAELTEVYREGHELRLEFSTTEARRAVLPLWTRDRATAAEIVGLLPTSRTIEIDESIARERRRFRLDVPFIGRLTTGLILLALIAAGLFRALVPEPSAGAADRVSPASSESVGTAKATDGDAPESVAAVAVPESLAPNVALPVETRSPIANTNEAEIAGASPFLPIQPAAAAVPTGTLRAPQESAVTPLVAGSRLNQLARRQLEGFQEHAANFYVQYFAGRKAPSELAAEWSSFSQRLVNSAEFGEPGLRPMIDAELTASASWSQALTMYAEGTRMRDNALIEKARTEIERAGDLTATVESHLPFP